MFNALIIYTKFIRELSVNKRPGICKRKYKKAKINNNSFLKFIFLNFLKKKNINTGNIIKFKNCLKKLIISFKFKFFFSKKFDTS